MECERLQSKQQKPEPLHLLVIIESRVCALNPKLKKDSSFSSVLLSHYTTVLCDVILGGAMLGIVVL